MPLWPLQKGVLNHCGNIRPRRNRQVDVIGLIIAAVGIGEAGRRVNHVVRGAASCDPLIVLEPVCFLTGNELSARNDGEGGHQKSVGLQICPG